MKNIKNKIDFVVMGFSALVLMAVIGFFQPLVIAPLNNYETTSNQILFSIEKGDKLLIDDNLDFTTPEEYDVIDGMKLDLEPGQYYWKVVGIGSSEIRSLKIKSEVILEFVEGDENFSVVNSGNIKLLVDVYDGEELIEKKKLEIGEKMESKGNKLIGEING